MTDLLGSEDLDANRRFDAARPSTRSSGGGNGTTSGTGAGAMLRLIRDGRASTRAELVALTGLARPASKRRFASRSSVPNKSVIAYQNATRNGLRLDSFQDCENLPDQFAAFA